MVAFKVVKSKSQIPSLLSSHRNCALTGLTVGIGVTINSIISLSEPPTLSVIVT